MATARRHVARPRVGIERLEDRRLLSLAGSLNPAFGGGSGSANVPLNVPAAAAYSVEADSVVVMADGHVVVSGVISINGSPGAQGASALAVARLNPDGSPDPSFGTGGLAVLPIGFGQTSFVAAVESDGKIIEAASSTGPQDFFALRLTASGSLDPTFGTGGVVHYPADTTTPAAARLSKVVAVLPGANNSVVLAGSSGAGFSAVRLGAGGVIDPTYGLAGTATVNARGFGNAVVFPQAAIATGAVIQADGKVVLTGDLNSMSYMVGVGSHLVESEVGVVRLNADGSLDTGFGGTSASGIVVIPPDLANPQDSGFNASTSVALQSTTGDLLVAGHDELTAIYPYTTFATLYRLNADGTRDTAFGTGGLVKPSLLDVNSGSDINLAVQANGSILLSSLVTTAPSNVVGASNQVELLRRNPDGTPDATFGNPAAPGSVVTRLLAFGAAPAISPVGGNILLAGAGLVPALSGPSYGFNVASFLAAATATGGPAAPTPAPTPPSSFTIPGESDLAIYDPTTGTFLYRPAQPAYGSTAFRFDFGPSGLGQTLPAAADYQGLGHSQFAAYLPGSGTYAILPTPASPGLFMKFGTPGAGQTIPVPADYEGTGRADVAVYLERSGAFAVLAPDGSAGRIVPFGTAGVGQSIPAPADYYRTGRADLAVYLERSGAFAVLAPDGKSGVVIPFGAPGLGVSIPVPGDYDGSGHVELAVYIPSLGAFFYRPGNGGPDVKVPFGTPGVGELPAVGDYDGSGRSEFAVYDPSRGFLAYRPAGGRPDVIATLGTPKVGAIPVATPSGALPEFAAPGSGGGGSVRKFSVEMPSPSASTPSASSVSASTVSVGAARPVGPKFAAPRVDSRRPAWRPEIPRDRLHEPPCSSIAEGLIS